MCDNGLPYPKNIEAISAIEETVTAATAAATSTVFRNTTRRQHKYCKVRTAKSLHLILNVVLRIINIGLEVLSEAMEL